MASGRHCLARYDLCSPVQTPCGRIMAHGKLERALQQSCHDTFVKRILQHHETRPLGCHVISGGVLQTVQPSAAPHEPDRRL